MSTRAQPQQVLEALRAGARTWEELKAATRLSDDQLRLKLGGVARCARDLDGGAKRRAGVRLRVAERLTATRP